MGRAVVAGYCWPQSVAAGGHVDLHLSSPGGRPVRVEVARVGARRDIVFSDDAVPADEHEIPKDAASRGCDWPVALTFAVDPAWRSGYYEVVMENTDGEKAASVGTRGRISKNPMLGASRRGCRLGS